MLFRSQKGLKEKTGDNVELFIDRVIAKLQNLTGGPGTLQTNIAAIPTSLLIGGLRTVKLAYKRDALVGEPRKCSTCGGTGITVQNVQIAPGMVTRAQAQCSQCNGGYRANMKKERCEVEVRIDKGAADKSKIKLKDKGSEAAGAEQGDVHFVIQQKPHA